MALDSYSNLKAALKNWLDRGSELDDYLDDFIDICEAEMRTEVYIRALMASTTLAISSGARTVSLPADFRDIRHLKIRDPDNTNSGYRYIRPAPEEIPEDEMADRSTNTDGPQYFFTVTDVITFEREADQAYTADLSYWADFDSLDDSNTSNEILTLAPNLYLYGSLKASAPVLREDERIQLWTGLYESMLNKLNIQQTKSRRTSQRRSRVRGSTP